MLLLAVLLITIFFSGVLLPVNWAWQSSSTFRGITLVVPNHARCCRHPGTTNSWVMRDASASYWFQVGDRVSVMEDVIKGGKNLRGKQGWVVETWEKCDVDPSCCCAEQVDPGMAVRVQFSTRTGAEEEQFFHYFAEEELVKITEDRNAPFDGMTCTAFKMEQLQKFQSQPRGIASFEPHKSTEEGAST